MLSLYFWLDMFYLLEARALRIEDATSHTEILGQLCKCLHCVKLWDSSFQLAENIKPNIQRWQLFAVLTLVSSLVANTPWILNSISSTCTYTWPYNKTFSYRWRRNGAGIRSKILWSKVIIIQFQSQYIGSWYTYIRSLQVFKRARWHVYDLSFGKWQKSYHHVGLFNYEYSVLWSSQFLI
jgi:hypothetical protein